MLPQPPEAERVRIGFLVGLAAVLVSCGTVPIMPSPTANVPAGLAFVRDSASLFPPGRRRQAEDALRRNELRRWRELVGAGATIER